MQAHIHIKWLCTCKWIRNLECNIHTIAGMLRTHLQHAHEDDVHGMVRTGCAHMGGSWKECIQAGMVCFFLQLHSIPLW